MKKITFLITFLLLCLVAFPQQYFSKGFVSNGDGNFLSGTKLQLGGYYIRHSTDSVWLEKPLGVWFSSISTVGSKYETKIDKSVGYLTWDTEDGWNFKDETYLTYGDVFLYGDVSRVGGNFSVTNGNVIKTPGYYSVEGLDTTGIAFGNVIIVDQANYTGFINNATVSPPYRPLELIGSTNYTSTWEPVMFMYSDNFKWKQINRYTDISSVVESDPIYSADSGGIVRFTDTTSIIATKADLIETVETASRTIYVSTTGSDVTGTGLVGAPFATILRALQDIKSILNESVIITIDVSTGVYDIDMILTDLYTSKMYFKRNAGIVVAGKFTNDVTGLTITTSGGSTPYIYNVTGATFTANQYQDYFFTNGTKYYPIVYNGVSTINSVVGAVSCNAIGHNTTVFNLISGNFIFNTRMSTLNSSITFQNIDLTSSTGAIRMSTNMILDYKFSKINCTQGNTDITVNRINFESCQFINSTGSWTNNSAKVQYKGTSLRKSGTKAGIGLVTGQNYNVSGTASEGLYLYNWLTAMRFFQGYFTYNIVSSVVIDNCTNGMSIRNGTYLQFSGYVPVYANGVTTLIINDETMYNNYTFTLATLYGTPTNMASSTVIPYGYVNPARAISISIPGIYGEFETPATATLADNSAGAITVGNITQNESVKIEYKINRGTSEEVGTIVMTKKADTNLSDISYFDDCGVSFTKSLVGNAITLNWATTSTGTAATIKYSITRIML
jgi:hypothetical protein